MYYFTNLAPTPSFGIIVGPVGHRIAPFHPVFIFSTDEKAVNMVQDIKDRKEYALYREGSPVRRSCTHFCLPENNTKMKHIRAIMMLAMSEEERVRIRIHMDGKYYILNNRID